MSGKGSKNVCLDIPLPAVVASVLASSFWQAYSFQTVSELSRHLKSLLPVSHLSLTCSVEGMFIDWRTACFEIRNIELSFVLLHTGLLTFSWQHGWVRKMAVSGQTESNKAQDLDDGFMHVEGSRSSSPSPVSGVDTLKVSCVWSVGQQSSISIFDRTWLRDSFKIYVWR